MKLIIKILTILLLFHFENTVGQTKIPCDSLFTLDFYPNMTPAKYAGGQSDLNKYLVNEIIPTVSSCAKSNDQKPTSLYIALIINKYGDVVIVDFVKSKLSKSCKAEIEEKLLSMKGWSPAQLNGKPVCSNFVIPVSCLKWE